MQSEAYKLSGFTVVISALGFLLRWLQDLRIAGPEGLAADSPVSALVVVVTILAAAVLALYVRHLLRQFDGPRTPKEALSGRTPLYGVIALVPAVLLALAGLLLAVKPGDDAIWPMMHRLCGGSMVIGAFGAAVAAVNIPKEDRVDTGRRGMWMLLFFAAFWLITGYRDAASDPVVWRFVVGILAQCMTLLAIYHTAGFFFGVPHPGWAIFSCNLAAFLCIMSAIDGSSLAQAEESMDLGKLAQSIAYGAMAAQQLIWAFVVTENLKTRPLTPVEQKKDA